MYDLSGSWSSHKVLEYQNPKDSEGLTWKRKGLTFVKNFLCAGHCDGYFIYVISFDSLNSLHGTDEGNQYLNLFLENS